MKNYGDKSTRYLADYVASKGINIKFMARQLGLSYNNIYNSLGRRDNARALRADEILKICKFIDLEPMTILKEIDEGEA